MHTFATPKAQTGSKNLVLSLVGIFCKLVIRISSLRLTHRDPTPRICESTESMNKLVEIAQSTGIVNWLLSNGNGERHRGGSRRGKSPSIERGREGPHAPSAGLLWYHPTYPERLFGRRYRVTSFMFMEVLRKVKLGDPYSFKRGM